MVVTNLQICFPNLGFIRNSRYNSSSGFHVSLSQDFVFKRDWRFAMVEQKLGFHLKRRAFGVFNALHDGEVHTRSTSSQILENELRFSPTFDDYVKVLESVRTERSTIPIAEGDVQSPKKKFFSRDASTPGAGGEKRKLSKSKKQPSEKNSFSEQKVVVSKDPRRSLTSQRRAVDEKSSSAWTLVEGILEKKAKEKKAECQIESLEGNRIGDALSIGRGNIKKNKHGQKMAHNSVLGKKRTGKRMRGRTQANHQGRRSSEELRSNKSARCDVDPGSYGMYKRSKSSEYGGLYESKNDWPIFAKVDSKTKSSPSSSKMNKQDNLGGRRLKTLEMDGNTSDKAMDVPSDILYASEKEICMQGSSTRNGKFLGKFMKVESVDSGDFVSSQRSNRNTVASLDISGEEMHGIHLEDRAAFRTFEVFTDVRNRPRVLRMEMEERIHNLAKWLNASDLNMPEWQFSKMIHGAKIKFSEHSILRIIQILGSFGNWKRVLQLVEWFHSRERFKYYKSRYIYTTALSVLGKARRPVEALNIFNTMRQGLSSYPDLAGYHCIAVTLGQAGLVKELFDVIDCMKALPTKKFDLGSLQKWDPRLKPDLVIYNAVLNACVQQKQWEGAFWVLQELKEQGLQPSNTTYGLIMEVMFACGKFSLVHEFFRKLLRTSIPGALNYKVLVNTLWREGKVDEAVMAVKDMERRGIVGCAGLYYDLARCLCSAGRCTEALQQISKISKVAKKPMVVAYTGLIQACLDAGNIENAAYIFNQMHNFCSPNVITNNIMLKSYVQHGMFEEANALFKKVLAASHEKRSKDELNQKAFPDKFTFNTMIEACAAANKWDDFEFSYQEMLLHGYHFDRRRHMPMVFNAWRAGKKNILKITWNHLVRHGRAPPPAIVKELFCKEMKDDEPSSAISFITIHEDMEVKAFSETTWVNLLGKLNISSKTFATLLSDLRSIISKTEQPHPVYQNLLNACKQIASTLHDGELLV
ncbi:hypothetical protein HPP92_012740 [Vanilla planifolia]|uniref:Pentatricopeptide repeat-containing protein n=1 Tax=Vanilla planifolia TaxID=51239 RepID=A0A835QVR8_VANPL|nr:hypothetical protein HPP92_012740 [Vanilla planifolia]